MTTIDAKETRDVRMARARLAVRIARHLRDENVVRLAPEKASGLNEWMRANERSTRR